MRQKLIDEFNIQPSIMSIHRYIKSFNYTLKRTTLIPERRNDGKTIDAREAYSNMFFNLLSDFDESRLYFVDEVGFNISMRSKIGRSLRGKNATHVVPGLRSRNISVCCAITKCGISKYHPQTSAYNTNSFKSFISSLMEYIRLENPGKSAIIMDNVPFHKNVGVKEIIEEEGHILIFLPPYSPFLNPIENMFAKWKQSIRSENVQNESQLFNAFENVTNITSADCAGFYRNMLAFLPKCLKREAITEG